MTNIENKILQPYQQKDKKKKKKEKNKNGKDTLRKVLNILREQGPNKKEEKKEEEIYIDPRSVGGPIRG